MNETLSERADSGRGRVRRWVLTAVAVLVAFGLGVALGQALNDNPRPGGSYTTYRTLPAHSGR